MRRTQEETALLFLIVSAEPARTPCLNLIRYNSTELHQASRLTHSGTTDVKGNVTPRWSSGKQRWLPWRLSNSNSEWGFLTLHCRGSVFSQHALLLAPTGRQPELDGPHYLPLSLSPRLSPWLYFAESQWLPRCSGLLPLWSLKAAHPLPLTWVETGCSNPTHMYWHYRWGSNVYKGYANHTGCHFKELQYALLLQVSTLHLLRPLAHFYLKGTGCSANNIVIYCVHS